MKLYFKTFRANSFPSSDWFSESRKRSTRTSTSLAVKLQVECVRSTACKIPSNTNWPLLLTVSQPYRDEDGQLWPVQGYLIFAPGTVEQGDIICILFRCNSRAGIRKIDGNGCYVVVGEAHLHGFMMGIQRWQRSGCYGYAEIGYAFRLPESFTRIRSLVKALEIAIWS